SPPMLRSLRLCSHSLSPPFFFHAPAPPEIYTLSLHDALPISLLDHLGAVAGTVDRMVADARVLAVEQQNDAWRSGWSLVSGVVRSEEHTSELQSLTNLVCRLLLEKKKKSTTINRRPPPSRLTT